MTLERLELSRPKGTRFLVWLVYQFQHKANSRLSYWLSGIMSCPLSANEYGLVFIKIRLSINIDASQSTLTRNFVVCDPRETRTLTLLLFFALASKTSVSTNSTIGPLSTEQGIEPYFNCATSTCVKQSSSQ